jgi:hypothetical protein
MSRTEELRRPVRFLRVGESGDPGLERPRLAALAPAVERFRRTLAAPRRAEPAPDRSAQLPALGGPAAGREAPLATVMARPAARLAIPQELDPADDDEAEMQVPCESVAARSGGPALEDAPRAPVEQAAAFAAPADGDAPEGWADRMARMVSTLCTRADPAFVTWTVTVPMDPQTLPQTELRLHLAPHWLSLRFSSQSQQSVQLIAAHRDRLVQLLERTPGLPHGIDVEIS